MKILLLKKNFFTNLSSKMIIVFLILFLIYAIKQQQQTSNQNIKHISSFKQLGKYHCQSFPIEILYRIASGSLSQQYGQQYSQFDCYIRQFVGSDGQGIQSQNSQQDQEQQEQQDQQQRGNVPQIDPVVNQYTEGLSQCLPKHILQQNNVKAVYKIWRFIRYIIQHDYAYEWMRAKMRSCYGYQAQKPNSWMDGQQSQERLKLNKLFSNQFYQYVDKMMFKDFLYPIMNLLKTNVIIAVNGSLTSSGKPLFGQFIESKNYIESQVMIPVIFDIQSQKVFTYTIPGIPLLFAGSSNHVSWGFSGILVDRSNIEEIQTVGNKFYHHDTQMWIKLQKRNISILVKNADPYQCSYMFSAYGTLYEKKNLSGKVSQYIARWREDEPRVRNIFYWMYQTIKNKGNLPVQRIQFPFNSLVLANQSGIYNYICPQVHPSYFIYPDMSQQPQQPENRWVKIPKRGYMVLYNSHLTTVNIKNYFDKQPLTTLQEEYVLKLRKILKDKKTISLQQMHDALMNLNTNPDMIKIKQLLLFIYRKSKFLFLQDQKVRKQCDQLIAMIDKWDNKLDSIYSPVFKLWYYYFKKFTFSYVSYSQLGKDIARFKALTDSYWVNQLQLWKPGTSYGQCDCSDWNDLRQIYNGSSLNSTCFYNVAKAINATRLQLINNEGSYDEKAVQYNTYNYKKVLFLKLGLKINEQKTGDELEEDQQTKDDEQESKNNKKIKQEDHLKGNDLEQALGIYFSKNLAFAAQIGGKVIYHRGYEESLRIYKRQQKSEKISDQNKQTNSNNDENSKKNNKVQENDQDGQL